MRPGVGYLALVALLSVVAAACGGDERLEHPTGADELVLRVETVGGLVPPEVALRELPELSLFGDGRLIVPGPQIAIYPGPALPNLLQRSASEEGTQAILAAASDAGLLGPDRHFDAPGIADLPTTSFTVVAEGTRHEISAYGLGFEGPTSPPLSDQDLAARRALADLHAKLGNPDAWLPQGSLGPEASYPFDELRVYAQRYELAPEPGLEQEERLWPLHEPLAAFGEPDRRFPDFRCGVVRDDGLERLLPDAQAANELTPWTNGGARYRLIFRPLLPDEHGCT